MKRDIPTPSAIKVALPAAAWEYVLGALAKQIGFVDGLPDLRPINISGMIRLSMERLNESKMGDGRDEALAAVYRCYAGGHPMGHDLVEKIKRLVRKPDGSLPQCNCTPCANERKIGRAGL